MILSHEIDRRTLLTGAAALGGSLLLPKIARSAPRRGGVLRCAMPYNPASLDPMNGRNGPDFNTLVAIYDLLIEIDPQTAMPRPGLAQKFTFTDPKTLVLDLVETAKFHDGTAVDAAAVKFNLDRFKTDKRSNYASMLGTVASVEATGKYQVTLHLTKADASLTSTLANRPGLMVSPKAVQDAAGGNIDRTPVGSGPFKFVSWADNDKVVLTRNDNYWRNGLPYLDGIVLSIISEQPTAIRAVTAGEADAGLGLDIRFKAQADRESTVTTFGVPTTYFYGIYTNFGRAPLDNVKLRQAIAWSLDRDALNTALAAGQDSAGCGVIPKAHWACDPATYTYYHRDVQQARQLLTEAGYPNGIDIPMIGWADQVSVQRQEAVMEQLKESGIRLQLTNGSPPDTAAKFFTQKIGAGRVSGCGGFADASQQYDNIFSKGAFYNAGDIEVPGYRELLDATLATAEMEPRKAALAKLQKFVIEQALIQTFIFQTQLFVTSKKVHGITVDIISNPRFHEAYMDA